MPSDDEAAIDRVIASQPGNVGALIREADLRAAAGDDKIANAFYQAALKAAAANPGTVPASELGRAQQAVQKLALRFQDYLESSLAKAGFAPGSRPPRFAKAVDILMGRRQAQSELQNPRSFFYPDLPQRRYYDNDEFPWASELESRTSEIRDERCR